MNDITDTNRWFISFPMYLLKKHNITYVNQIYLRHMDIQNCQILDFNEFFM